MNKEIVVNNINDLLNNGFFLDKYIELTENIVLPERENPNYDRISKRLEEIAANLFNAILIGCQLFDDRERQVMFIDMFNSNMDSELLTMMLSSFNISEEEAMERLKHGFAVHFTTTNICNEIIKTGKLVGSRKNAMFTEEEDQIISRATQEQKANDPTSEETMNYLFRGFGTGVSSYGSRTNGFWMYHTPESLSFLFGDVSRRNKEESMSYVAKKISALSEENKKETFETMSNIFDRLIGEEQSVGCILIDRDAIKYEVDYYYSTGEPVAVERRPYSNGLYDLDSNDNIIENDIPLSGLAFLKIPTILELEKMKQEELCTKK